MTGKIWPIFMDPMDGIQNAFGMSMGSIYDDNVDPRIRHQPNPIFKIGANSYRGSGEQSAAIIVSRIRIIPFLLNIFDCQ